MKYARILWTGFMIFAAVGVSGAEGTTARLEGVIRGERGEPLVGAIVSVFGANLVGGGVIALSDENGRFRISELPPGLYTLRAYLSGFLPSHSSRIEVSEHDGIPEQVSMKLARLEAPKAQERPFLVEGELEEGVPTAEDKRQITELKWLLRHGKRNVLHKKGVELEEEKVLTRVADHLVIEGPDVDVNGEVGVMASATEEGLLSFPGAGAGLDARLAYARLEIPTGARHHWEVDAQLMESIMSSWAGRAEFIIEGAESGLTSAGVSYGNHLYGDLADFRPPEAGLSRHETLDRSREWFGTVFGSHRFELGEAEIDAGMIYHYFSYLDQSAYAAPHVEARWSPNSAKNTVLRGYVGYQVLAPGGEDLDLLARMVSADTIGTAGSAPRGLRAEKTLRSQVALHQRLDESSTVEVQVFQEEATAQLVKVYIEDDTHRGVGPGYYQVTNGGNYRTRGVGVALTRRFGSVASSVGYRFGLARALNATVPIAFAVGGDKEIHDLVTSLETEIERTRTRLLAVYRLMSHPSFLPGDVDGGDAVLDSRFNVQVHQSLPFMGWDKTQWELMLAVRNIFYQDLESAALLDELAVIDSPRRVLGGVSVRF